MAASCGLNVTRKATPTASLSRGRQARAGGEGEQGERCEQEAAPRDRQGDAGGRSERTAETEAQAWTRWHKSTAATITASGATYDEEVMEGERGSWEKKGFTKSFKIRDLTYY